MEYFIYVGIGLLVVSGLILGVFTTGPQQRANFFTTPEEDLRKKQKISTILALLAVVSFAIAYIIHLFSK